MHTPTTFLRLATRWLAIVASLPALLVFGAESPVRRNPKPNDSLVGLQPGLGSLPLLGQGRTRSVSPENPTGKKGRGAMGIPNPNEGESFQNASAADDLGQGWKVHPFIRLDAGQTKTIMDVAGPGVIQLEGNWILRGLDRVGVICARYGLGGLVELIAESRSV